MICFRLRFVCNQKFTSENLNGVDCKFGSLLIDLLINSIFNKIFELQPLETMASLYQQLYK